MFIVLPPGANLIKLCTQYWQTSRCVYIFGF